MDLREYIESRGIMKNFVAKKLDISITYLFKLMNGTSTPSLEVASKIEEFTEGKIKIRDWVKKSPPTQK